MARTRDLWFSAKRDPDGKKIKTRRHPDNGGNRDADRWLAVWMVDGREKSKSFRTQALADAYGSRMDTEIAAGDYIDPDAGNVKMSALAAKWLSLREVGGSTRIRYESCWRLHIEPVFGNRAAGKIPPSDVAAWSKSLAGMPGTRNLALIILAGIFDLAVADRVRRDNPAKSDIVGRPKMKRTERDAWPAKRVHAVADAADELWRLLILTAAGLGLREGEAFGLAAGDFTGDGVVHIRRQLARGTQPAFKLPKGGKVRTVPVGRGVTALVEAAAPVAVTLPWQNEDGTFGAPVTVNLLWVGVDGKPIQSWRWHRYQWQPALLAAGIPKAHENGMHALRHFHSTTLLDNGVSLAGVMEFLGHSRENAPLAVGVYGHVTEVTFQAARDAVDRTLFRLRSVGSDGTVTELRSAR